MSPPILTNNKNNIYKNIVLVLRIVRRIAAQILLTFSWLVDMLDLKCELDFIFQISKQLGAGGIGVVYKVERVPSLEEAKENNGANHPLRNNSTIDEVFVGSNTRRIRSAALKAETIDPKRRYKETLKVEVKLIVYELFINFTSFIVL